MRKSKKTLAILTIIAMVLMMVPVQAFADTPASNRLADADRIGTAIAIANNGWTSASTVIVAPADDANLVDALAVAPLAGQDNAPILMTYKDGLDAKVAAEIAALKATNVIAVGALSDAAVNQLKAISGVTVNQVKGADRFETAAKIAGMLTSPAGTFVVAYNGLADALSAASFAAANKYAIMIADTNGALPASETAVGSKTYTVGGQVTIAGATAFAGADRYATNDAVLKGLTYKYDKVFVANGETLVDALAGSALAAKTQSPIVLANTTGAAAAAGVQAKLSASSQVIAFGGTAVVPDAVLGSVSGTTQPTGPVSVSSVSAIGANSLKVVFSAAPADTSKVTFTVTNATVPVAVTASWDSTNTVATLSAGSNLPTGDYTVAVKNDTTDLGSSTVSITQQAIKSIKITSDKLAVTSNGHGFFNYQVLDQYGADITGSYLSNNIQFTVGVATYSKPSTGVIELTPTGSLNLIQFPTVTVSAYDQTSGVSTSATLTTSTALGTLSSIKLNSLSSPTNAVLTAQDTTDVWYVDYTATDMSGQETNNYSLVKGGLLLGDNANGTGDALTTSNPYVLANVVQDPNDSNKAAIQVKVTGDAITVDSPVAITAMGYTGSASTLNVTLKKASALDSLTLMAPSYNIASSETKQIPFVAYDQNGKQLTKYSDLNTIAVLSGGIFWSQNPDGTATLKVNAISNTGSQPISQIVTATTPTGKLSTLSLSIQPVAKAATLALDSSVLVNAMEVGATQQVDFGFIGGNGGLSVKDQYGRAMDMVNDPTNPTNNGQYEVLATASGQVSATGGASYGGNAITLNASNTAGTGSVTFNLVDSIATTTILDSKTVSFSIVNHSDIKGYTIDQVSSPLYTAYANGTTTADVQADVSTTKSSKTDYYANPNVYGTTSSGGKVMLEGTMNAITGIYTDSSNFVAVYSDGAYYDTVKVFATKFSDLSKTSGSANLTVTIRDYQGTIHSVSTPISSSTSGPAAASIGLSFDGRNTGISQSNDIITVDLNAATVASPAWTYNGYLTRFDNSTGAAVTKEPIYFYAKDQYGTKAMSLASISKAGTSTVSDAGFTVNSTTGQVTSSYASINNGDYADVTAVTTSGLVKTIRIKFVK